MIYLGTYGGNRWCRTERCVENRQVVQFLSDVRMTLNMNSSDMTTNACFNQKMETPTSLVLPASSILRNSSRIRRSDAKSKGSDAISGETTM
jgi:hypothetical protein